MVVWWLVFCGLWWLCGGFLLVVFWLWLVVFDCLVVGWWMSHGCAVVVWWLFGWLVVVL